MQEEPWVKGRTRFHSGAKPWALETLTLQLSFTIPRLDIFLIREVAFQVLIKNAFQLEDGRVEKIFQSKCFSLNISNGSSVVLTTQKLLVWILSRFSSRSLGSCSSIWSATGTVWRFCRLSSRIQDFIPSSMRVLTSTLLFGIGNSRSLRETSHFLFRRTSLVIGDLSQFCTRSCWTKSGSLAVSVSQGGMDLMSIQDWFWRILESGAEGGHGCGLMPHSFSSRSVPTMQFSSSEVFSAFWWLSQFGFNWCKVVLPWLWAVLTSTWLLVRYMSNQSLVQLIAPSHASE